MSEHPVKAKCLTCGESSNLKRCSLCHQVWYCGVDCQKKDRGRHRREDNCGAPPQKTEPEPKQEVEGNSSEAILQKEAEIQRLTEELAKKEKERQIATELPRKLFAQIQDAQQLTFENECLQKRAAKMDKQLEQQRSQIEKLTKKLEDNERGYEDLISSKKHWQHLRDKLVKEKKANQEEIEQLRKRLVVTENAQQKCKQLRMKEQEMNRDDIEQLQGRLAEAQQRMDQLRENSAEAMVQLAKERKENEEICSRMGGEILKLEERNASLQRQFFSKVWVDAHTWQFEADSNEWAPFAEAAQTQLMDTFLAGNETCPITSAGTKYHINFKEMLQTNPSTKKVRKIRCFFGLPKHWKMSDESMLDLLKNQHGNPEDASSSQGMSWRERILNRFFRTGPQPQPSVLPIQESLQEVTDIPTWQRLESLLNKSTKRHDDSQCLCLHGSSTFKLQKAYQVKHRQLWQRYQRCLRNIHDKHKRDDILPDKIDPPVGDALAQFAKEIEVDPAKTECLLFHGTRSFDLAQQIAEEGFDNRIALSSGLYGKGTYFAAQTCKSAQYAILNGNGTKASFSEMGTMIVARVAIGDPFYTPGPLQDPRPPLKNHGRKDVRADSVIVRPGIPNGQSASGQYHMEVVTFAPEQAYPEYILRYVES